MDLTYDELDLLHWLWLEDVSQYGECHGPALDSLIEKGLARVHGPESGLNNPFIAKGRGMMYRAVSLTEAGRTKVMETVDKIAELREKRVADYRKATGLEDPE